jgi:thiol-disulfide isomerase/thioredoxin
MNDVIPERKRSWGSDENQESGGENSGCLGVVRIALLFFVLFILVIGLLVVIAYFREKGREDNDLNGMDPQDFQTPVDHPAVGQALPNIELEHYVNTDENYWTSSEDSIRLINLWAVECPPCAAETPYLAKVHEEFKSEPGFKFLSVCMTDAFSSDRPASPDDVKQFLWRAGEEELPVYRDSQSGIYNAIVQFGNDEPMRLQPEHQSLPIPVTILVDRDDVICEMWVGFDPVEGDLIADEMMRRISNELTR